MTAGWLVVLELAMILHTRTTPWLLSAWKCQSWLGSCMALTISLGEFDPSATVWGCWLQVVCSSISCVKDIIVTVFLLVQQQYIYIKNIVKILPWQLFYSAVSLAFPVLPINSKSTFSRHDECCKKIMWTDLMNGNSDEYIVSLRPCFITQLMTIEGLRTILV